MRYTGIDILRGISVLGMVIFHANYLLQFVFGYDTSIYIPQIIWNILGPTVALIFIGVSGFSLFLSEKSGKSTGWKKSGKRTIILSSLAACISWATLVYFPEQKILWGIIHFFAFASLLSPFVHLLGRYVSILTIFILIVGYGIGGGIVDSAWLIPFGWIPEGFYSADYYPLFPWFGYYLLGYALAQLLSSRDRLSLLAWKENPLTRIFTYMGKNALLIYIVHVPILYIFFSLFF